MFHADCLREEPAPLGGAKGAGDTSRHPEDTGSVPTTLLAQGVLLGCGFVVPIAPSRAHRSQPLRRSPVLLLLAQKLPRCRCGALTGRRSHP